MTLHRKALDELAAVLDRVDAAQLDAALQAITRERVTGSVTPLLSSRNGTCVAGSIISPAMARTMA